jgi:hypothetical protein
MKVNLYLSDGTWYDKDSICVRISELYDGITPDMRDYYGTRTSQTEEEVKAGWPLGTKYQRSEICEDGDFEFRADVDVVDD